MKKIYESDNWIIEKDDEDDVIRISLFKDSHFVDDIMLSREDFLKDKMNIIREILYV